MKIILPFFLLISSISYAQTADFIILKKKGKTVETFYAGTHIAFTSNTGAYRDALINQIKNDTLYIQEFITRYALTTYGTYIIDTIGSYHYQYHYNQVAAMGRKENKGFDTKGSGAALLGGGIVLTVASGVVYLVDRKKFSAPLLIASAALGTLGYFMSRGRSSSIVIGKKYKMVYMSMSSNN
jgi:hypothetical protein